MVSCMKTTVDLPDDLLIDAKKRAAELRRPLRSIIEAGLRAELAALASRGAVTPPEIEWVTAPGGLPVGLDLDDRAALGEWLLRQRAAD